MTKTARNIIDYAYITAGSAHIAGWNLGLTIFALTMPLFFIGMKLFGREYGVKTLMGSLLLSAFTAIWSTVFGTEGILDYSKDMSVWLSALYGGVISGVGIGFVMKSGSNTGGTDIIAQIMARYTSLSLGTSLFIVDGIIIAVSAVFFGLENALYAIIVAYITTVAINKIVLSMGTNYAKTIFIITSRTNDVG